MVGVDPLVRDRLASIDQATPEEQWVVLCFLAGRGVALDEDERRAALRRAELLLATGGDPRRVPEITSRAVSVVAADLDAPERRAGLLAALEGLAPAAGGLEGTGEALRSLLADADLAWRAFALALLVERLADEE